MRKHIPGNRASFSSSVKHLGTAVYFPSNVMVKAISPSVKIMRDVHIPTRDGSYLSANIYMPSHEGAFPVLLSLHPARKDALCKDGYMHIQLKFAR